MSTWNLLCDSNEELQLLYDMLEHDMAKIDRKLKVKGQWQLLEIKLLQKSKRKIYNLSERVADISDKIVAQLEYTDAFKLAFK